MGYDAKNEVLIRATGDESVSEDEGSSKVSDLTKKTTYWYDYWNEHIQSARQHVKFLYIDQWDEAVRSERESRKVPVLQFNTSRPTVDGILGEQRKNSPQIYIQSITEENSEIQKLDWRTDLIREISCKSKSDDAYQTCLWQQLVCGWGFLRASIHYESDDSFKKCLKISSDSDIEVAFWDPSATELLKQDGDYCGVYQTMSRDDFKRQYPDIEAPVSACDNVSVFHWQTRDTITVCDLYEKEYEKVTLVKLSDDRDMLLSEAEKEIELAKENQQMVVDGLDLMMEEFGNGEVDTEAFLEVEPLTIVDRRDVMRYKIIHYRFIENQLLDSTPWPGKILPIVFVPGDKVIMDSRELPISFVNDLQDPAKLNNYIMSEMARGILNTHRTRWIGTKDMIKGYSQAWRQPDQEQGMLFYNQQPNGNKPEAINPPPFSESLLALQQIAEQQIQKVSGRFEETRGQESNAIASVSIIQRKIAGNNVVNLYVDNLTKGIEQIGHIIMDLLPEIYGDEQEVTVRTVEGLSKKMKINKRTEAYNFPQNFNGEMGSAIDQAEEKLENDIRDKNYTLYVKAAGSFDTQRQESMQFWLEYMRADPQSVPFLRDIVVGESNVEDATKAKNRLKTLLPPEITAMENGDPPPPPQPPPIDPMIAIEEKKVATWNRDLSIKEKQQEREAQKDALQMKIDLQKLELDKQKVGIQGKEAAVKSSVAVRNSDINEFKAVTSLHKKRG